MFRSIAAAVVGYIAMSVCIVGGLTGLFAVFGTEASYQFEGWLPSTTFMIGMVVIGVVGAALAAFVARGIDRKGRCDLILIGIILTLNVVSLIMQENRPDPGPRPAEATMADAQNKSITPPYLTAIYTFAEIGVILLIARRMRRE